MTCKLCGKPRQLVKRSHVIPQWMYDLLPNDGRNFVKISPVEGEYESRSQTGEYASFVCRDCEDRFGRWDDYAAKVLRVEPKETVAGVDFGPYNPAKLKRFYLSVLWRMSAYGRQFLSVDLGAEGPALAHLLRYDDDSSLDRYEVVPVWSDPSHLLSCGFGEPGLWEIAGVPYWRIYMPKFQALINISGRPGADCLSPWRMGRTTNLLMPIDTFECGEMDIAMHAVRTNMERKNGRRG